MTTRMRQLYLHIGTEKTGSTSIQRVLGTNEKALFAQNCCYPDTEEGLLRAMLGRTFSPHGKRKAAQAVSTRDRALQQKALESFTRQIETLPDSIERVIVVGELLSRQLFTEESIERLKAFLAPHFSAVRIIVYLRRQDAHFASAYTQSLRTGIISLPEIEAQSRQHGIYDYAALLARWASVFGEDSVLPRIYERGPGTRFDVLDDFSAVCGFSLPDRLTEQDRVRNPSVSLAGQHVMLDLGRKLQAQSAQNGARTLAGPAWRRVALAVTELSPGTGWQPTQSEARGFVGRYAASNEAVRARWFPERASLFSEDFSNLPEQPVQPDPGEVRDLISQVAVQFLTEGLRREQELLVEKALIAREFGDIKQCRAILSEAVQADGNHAPARAYLAALQIEAGEMAEARKNLDVALAVKPHSRLVTRMERRWVARNAKDAVSETS